MPEATVTSSPKRTKVPTILQQAAVECGAASLGMILAHYGRWETLDALRNACGVTRDGANALAIVNAGTKFGLDHKAGRGTVSDLDAIAVPVIIWWKQCHFMVLEGVRDGKFHVNDPARGRYVIDAADFAAGYSGISISFSPNADFTESGHRYRATPALWRRLRSSTAGVWFAIIAGVAAMLLGLVIAPISAVFINDVLGAGNSSILATLGVALLAIGLIRAALTLLEFGVITRIQAKLTMVGNAQFLNRLVRLPLLFYLDRSAGDLSQRVGYNSTIASLLASQMASSGIALVGAIGYAALLLYYNVWIGLVVLALAMVNVVALRLVMARRTEVQGRVIRRQNQLRGTTTASIRGIETIKATGMEDDVFTKLAGQQADYISATTGLVPSSSLLVALPTLVFALTSAAVLVLGGYFTITGAFTIGALLAVQALAMNLNSPIQTLMNTGSQMQVITSSLQALDDVMANDLAPRFLRPSVTMGEPIPRLTGAIAMESVSFGYGPSAPLVLTDFSMTLNPGMRVALVGASGSGKSTIGNLAAGLYRPRTGRVLYDGKPMDDYPIGVVERSLAKVDQTIVLFEGTLRQNVTLWDPTIPDDDVRQALADAQILDDVLARELGIDCAIEENGRNFSGGQCQRMEIARALVLNPRVIVLDEATSALDDVTEMKVDEALRRRGVACLIIAHRLSTIRDADEIVFLGRGGVVLERGDHVTLMAAAGPYSQMIAAAGEGGNVGT